MKLILLTIIVTSLFSAFVYADDESDASVDEDTEATDAPVLVSPALLKYIQADYPSKAFEAGVEAAVVAKLSIDETGFVTGVEIVEAAGHGFDEAAKDAMLRFEFAPATSDGEPISSQVMYRYTFFIKEQEREIQDKETPPVAELSGRITDMDGLPIPEALVILTLAKDTSEISLNKNGEFFALDLVPGKYKVEIIAPGYVSLTSYEDLVADEARELIYRLTLEPGQYETVVKGRRPPREVTRREITRQEMLRIPGTYGDALRSVQNMPGVARAPGMRGELLVRGSSPSDSRTFFDHMPVPLLYHFGGMTSVVNSELLDRIDFFPGNYSVRYGGATGGIIDVYPKKPRTDRFHAIVDADIWDIGALVETPIGNDWSVAVAGRRSYIDGILNAVLPKDGGMQFTVAPRYYDYQLIVDYHPDAEKNDGKKQKDNLRLFLYGSDDKMVFLFGDDVSGNPNFGGGVSIKIYFHQAQLRWDHKFRKGLTNELNIGSGLWGSKSSFGDNFLFNSKQVPVFLRDEISWKLNKYFILRTGLDTEIDWVNWKIRSPMAQPGEGEAIDPFSANDQPLETSGNEWYYRPAWYGELELTALERLRLIYGLRVDYYSYMKAVGLDPRFVARYKLFEGTVLKGGMGLFHQTPDFSYTDKSFGNPDLSLTDAIHYSLGVEQQITDDIEVGLEGFYKDISRLPVSSDKIVERDGQLVPERYNNDGLGQVYGLEFMLKHKPTDRFFGWISYTLMQSSRVDHPGEDKRLFDFDQTHILTIVGSLVLGRGWEAGIRFRLVSGNPITPIAGAAYDADSDIYWPMRGKTNSDRLPMFHQLDVRIDKSWKFKYLKFGVYIDVQNVYNHSNVEAYDYNYDYSQRVYFTGLPILPSLGLKLEY